MLELNFTPFPTLETERLLLRQLNAADTDNLFYVRTHPDVLRYTNMAVHQNAAETGAYIELILGNALTGKAIMWAIALKTDPSRLLGTSCFWNIEPEHDRAETGYILHPEFHGQGLMGEALPATIKYGFEVMKLHEIVADVHCENTPSVKVLLRNGFTQQEIPFDEAEPNRASYALFATQP